MYFDGDRGNQLASEYMLVEITLKESKKLCQRKTPVKLRNYHRPKSIQKVYDFKASKFFPADVWLDS